jgi:hypothetical protein
VSDLEEERRKLRLEVKFRAKYHGRRVPLNGRSRCNGLFTGAASPAAGLRSIASGAGRRCWPLRLLFASVWAPFLDHLGAAPFIPSSPRAPWTSRTPHSQGGAGDGADA